LQYTFAAITKDNFYILVNATLIG